MHHVAVGVGHHLQFDVTGAVEVFFDVNLVIAESRFGFGAGELPGFLDLVRAARHLHATAAATGRSLDDDGVADLLGASAGLFGALHRAGAAGNQRHAQPAHRVLGRNFVAHHADVLGLGADEGQAVGFHHLGEVGVLAEEAVAGMDCLGPGDGGGGEKCGHVQVAVACRWRADADAFIGQADMHGRGIGGGMHGNGADAHFLAGAVDAQRDLAAVGDQDLGERPGHSISMSGWPYSTGVPGSIRMRVMVPDLVALIWLKVFIASISSSVWPAVTWAPTWTKGGLPGSGER